MTNLKLILEYAKRLHMGQPERYSRDPMVSAQWHSTNIDIDEQLEKARPLRAIFSFFRETEPAAPVPALPDDLTSMLLLNAAYCIEKPHHFDSGTRITLIYRLREAAKALKGRP